MGNGGTVVLALGCHPDDIEFMMAGTLFLLKQAGCSLHLMCMANGCCGSMVHGAEETAAIRRQEAADAADFLGARLHPSLANDLEVFYTDELIRKTTAVIRSIEPGIMLLPSPEDYMEDHMNTSRIGVTAAFSRGMPNYRSIPPVAPVSRDITLYHALPYGLTDGLRRSIEPDRYVDISPVMEKKRQMLACHRSQKEWLDASQGMDSYLNAMVEQDFLVGRRSGRFEYAEGWRRHSSLGYSSGDLDPLKEILRSSCLGVLSPEAPPA